MTSKRSKVGFEEGSKRKRCIYRVIDLPTELQSVSELSTSTVKPHPTSLISHKSIKSIETTTTATQRSDVSLANPPMYNFSVNSLTSLESIYFNGKHLGNQQINVLVYLISVDINTLTLRDGSRMTKFNLTAADEAGFPIEISVFDKEGKADEEKCRKGDIIYLQGAKIKTRGIESIPTPVLTSGNYVVCYRFNVHPQDKHWRGYRPDWLATHRPSIRVLKLYEWVESNL